MNLKEIKINDGIVFLDKELSQLEKQLFNDFEQILLKNNFKYLSIPSIVSRSTIEKQNVFPWEKILKINDTQGLAGSAEQGILELFENQFVEPEQYYAKNQCFRYEEQYNGLKYCKEFIKLEQFIFCKERNWQEKFDLVLSTATEFLINYNLQFRIVDVSKRDKGYHLFKKDIEVYTKTYGWMETHSCTYFGEEQTKRFNIKGATHTISNTGIASPRILIPFIE